MQFQIAANNTFLLARIKLLRLLGLLFGLGTIQHGTVAIPVLNGYSRCCCYEPCFVHFRYDSNVLDSNLNTAAKVLKHCSCERNLKNLAVATTILSIVLRISVSAGNSGSWLRLEPIPQVFSLRPAFQSAILQIIYIVHLVTMRL